MNNQPNSIQAYLDALRFALKDCDPAVVQDAVYDAEEYLRAAIAEHSDLSEADALAIAMRDYGSPDDVANEYRKMERMVQKALRTPLPKQSTSTLGKVFGIYADPYAYAALFYMLMSLATGIFYFTWVVTGLSLSLGLAILIFGIPFFVLFIASTRLLSLIEGRIVETLLNERMPRRPPVTPTQDGVIAKIKFMLSDRRTWSTVLYMFAMMPIGIVYFTAVVVAITLSLALIAAPFVSYFASGYVHFHDEWMLYWPNSLLLAPLGFLGLTFTLHVAKWVGRLHGQISKQLLVAV
jgi:uncharacterized membrane protein